MSVNQRIKSALKERNVSYQDLADEIGVTVGGINNRLNRSREIDDINFINTVAQLTGYSANWIITGEGENIISEPNSAYQHVESKKQNYKTLYDQLLIKYESLEREIKSKEETVEAQRKTIDTLENTLKDVRVVVDQLKKLYNMK